MLGGIPPLPLGNQVRGWRAPWLTEGRNRCPQLAAALPILHNYFPAVPLSPDAPTGWKSAARGSHKKSSSSLHGACAASNMADDDRRRVPTHDLLVRVQGLSTHYAQGRSLSREKVHDQAVEQDELRSVAW